MKCFHYHWWTDKVEEMEAWYRGIGFETRQRIGRVNGAMREFNPPPSNGKILGKKMSNSASSKWCRGR
ncbi:hypothetical protein [Rossellomorea marisflavi]|uniref:hypothetical protein n=1 Tax=Rossellomorea marisflavi TaxID=189381 RepID=UPI00351745A2